MLVVAMLALTVVSGTPLLFPEFPVDTNVTYCPEPAAQTSPALARGLSTWLVVWDDENFTQGNSNTNIRAARLTLDGRLMDTLGFSVCFQPYEQSKPQVAFDGGNYLVVWQDTRSGNDTPDVYAARVTEQGTVLDPDGFPVSLAARAQRTPVVAYDGANCVVAWQDFRTPAESSNIVAARVNAAGQVLDSNGIVVSRANNHQRSPSIARFGTGSLVAWADYRNDNDFNIRAARVTRDGSVLDPTGIVVSSAQRNQTAPSVAASNTRAVISWSDCRNAESVHVYAARLDSLGAVLDPTGIPVSRRPAVGSVSTACWGANYLVAWDDMRDFASSVYDIYGARLTTSGVLLDTNGFRIRSTPNAEYSPAIAADSSGGRLVCEGDTGYPATYLEVLNLTLDSAGRPSEPVRMVTQAANTELLSSVCSNGTTYLVVWQEYRLPALRQQSDVFAWMLDGQLRPIYAGSIAVSQALNAQTAPSVGPAGAGYIVTWEDTRRNTNAPDIFASRIATNGSVVDPNGIPVNLLQGSKTEPAAAGNGTGYLIVWRTASNQIRCTVVDSSGTVRDTAGVMLGTGRRPQVSWGVDDYLVTWESYPSNTSIYGTRVTPAGTVRPPGSFLISSAAQGRSDAHVAFDGTKWLVVWQDSRSSTSDIYGARVNQSGVVVDPQGVPIGASSYNEWQPSLAYLGDERFLVTWLADRVDSADIFGATFSSEGMTLDSFLVLQHAGRQENHASASAGAGTGLVTYDDWADRVHGKPCQTRRVFGVPYPSSTGISELPKSGRMPPTLTIAPNPATRSLRVELSPQRTATHHLNVFDVTGRLRRSVPLSIAPGGTASVQMRLCDGFGRDLPAGVYYCSAIGDSGVVATARVVVAPR